jgi:hypothetical protein
MAGEGCDALEALPHCMDSTVIFTASRMVLRSCGGGQRELAFSMSLQHFAIPGVDH